MATLYYYCKLSNSPKVRNIKVFLYLNWKLWTKVYKLILTMVRHQKLNPIGYKFMIEAIKLGYMFIDKVLKFPLLDAKLKALEN